MFFINIVLVAGGLYLLNYRIPGSTDQFEGMQTVAKELVEHNRQLAKNLGVEARSPVRESLSRFNYEIDLANNLSDLSKAILANASRTQERILQEHEARQRETLLSLINQDPALRLLDGRQRLTVKVSRDHGVQAEPAGVLSEQILQKIAETVKPGELAQDLTVDVEVNQGRALLLMPLDLQEQVRTLTREVDSLRVALHEVRSKAGFAEMTGPGVIVRIFDAANGFTNEAIIHETDVRDTVNELFAAGARGVAIANQRLTASTAIRCVGPSILVNDERIPVNPVVISAVGDPDVLASGLDIIRITLEVSRNLRVEIERVPALTLPAHSR
jgi:uncharacterized protein YlxW (UPF0749 family)